MPKNIQLFNKHQDISLSFKLQWNWILDIVSVQQDLLNHKQHFNGSKKINYSVISSFYLADLWTQKLERQKKNMNFIQAGV